MKKNNIYLNAGAPPKYDSVEKLQEKIIEYFDGGMNHKTIVIGSGADRKTKEIPVPTISGLAMFLGFASRQSFYDYGSKDEFSYTIKKARFAIEVEYEQNLQSGNVVGAIFALKNLGWKDESKVVQTNINSKELTDKEVKKLDKQLEKDY